MYVERLKAMEKRYEEINELMQDPSIVTDVKINWTC